MKLTIGTTQNHSLKPCPFCGSVDIYTSQLSIAPFIRCNGCKARTPECDTLEDAVTLWNSRSTPVDGPLTLSPEKLQLVLKCMRSITTSAELMKNDLPLNEDCLRSAIACLSYEVGNALCPPPPLELDNWAYLEFCFYEIERLHEEIAGEMSVGKHV